MPPTLSPQDFVAKWKRSELREQAGYQEHLLDLCRLAGHPTPAEYDPTWLDLAHKKLDEAVLDAYGWPRDIDDEEILERLLALNLERAKA